MERDERRPRPPTREDSPKKLGLKQILAKAAVLTGREVEESAAIDTMEQKVAVYGENGAVEPPYDPDSLLNYIEMTPHLRPCIDAYAQNIEGYGYQPVVIEPWIGDIDSDVATESIRNALLIERWVDEEEAALEGAETPEPESEDDEEEENNSGEVTDEEIEAVREGIKNKLLRERYMFDAFFKNCCSMMSFTKLRRITRGDIESNGWGAWEMLRDGAGRLKRLNYVPGYTVRPLTNEGELIEAIEPDPVTPISEGREVKVYRRFRRYVQIVGGRKVFYKSPGDPRVISRQTGNIYESVEDMRKPEDKEGEGKLAMTANELIYIALHDPRTPCPPPRWIGNLLAVLGVREADEANYFYLDGNAIPPGILFISGGKVSRDMKDRLERRGTAELSGPQNNHKILVVEATPMKFKGDDRTLLPSIHYESLRDSQRDDAMFTNYDERSADRIGASFRLPPMIRGYTPSNLNRATAIAALSFAEGQVFEPEREEIDWVVNKYILPEIGVSLHKFKSNSPPTRSPEEIAELIKVTAPHGGLLPFEIRDMLSTALNKSMVKIQEEWVRWPMPMTLVGMGNGASPAPDGGVGDSGSIADTAQKLEQLRQRVEAIVTNELRAIGMGMEVSASYRDPSDLEVDDGTE